MLHLLFDPVKTLLEIESVNIETTIFRLHYKATVAILLVFSLIVTGGQFIGDPIDCIVDVDAVPSKVMDTFCWIHSTFTLYNQNATEESTYPYPGVGPQGVGDTIKHHKYYQWVCFVLFLQAILFYFPRFLWQTCEANKMEMLTLDLNNPVIKEESKNECKKLLVDYFTSNMHTHTKYAITFFLCEILNFVNIMGQIFFMNFFLGGQFTTYGLDVIGMTVIEPQFRSDPMSKVFPKMAKCSFPKFGPSGTPEYIDGLCLLPLNILNEKIYVFLWFWFLSLAAVTGFAIIYRLAVIFPQFRLYLLRSQAPLAQHQDLKYVVRKCRIGDWFVLVQLSKNINPIFFKELIGDLADKLHNKTPLPV